MTEGSVYFFCIAGTQLCDFWTNYNGDAFDEKAISLALVNEGKITKKRKAMVVELVLQSLDCLTLEKRIRQQLEPYFEPSGVFCVPDNELRKIKEILTKLNAQINAVIKKNTCELCNYSCYRNYNFEAHLKRRDHLLILADQDEAIQQKYQYRHFCTIYNSENPAKSIAADAAFKCEFVCPRCNRQFTQKGNLTRHMKRVKPCMSDDGTGAPVTTKTFPQRVAGGAMPLRCSKCHKTYTRRDNLKRHMIACRGPGEFSEKRKVLRKSSTGIRGPSEAPIEHVEISSDHSGDNETMLSSPNYEKSDFLAPKSTAFQNFSSISAPKFTKQHRSRCDSVLKHPKSELECEFCGGKFGAKRSLIRHQRTRCKVKLKEEDEREQIFELLIQKMDEQNDKIQLLESQLSNQQATINNYNQYNDNRSTVTNTVNDNRTMNDNRSINIQNNNEIKLLAFGKEDLSHLTKGLCKHILNLGFASVPSLIDKIHFNEGKPENHNVYVSNLRDKYAMVYTGAKWEVTDRNYVIKQLYEEKKEYLEGKFTEMEDQLSHHAISRFRRFLGKNDNDQEIRNVKEDIKATLYNNRGITQSTQKLIEEDRES